MRINTTWGPAAIPLHIVTQFKHQDTEEKPEEMVPPGQVLGLSHLGCAGCDR